MIANRLLLLVTLVTPAHMFMFGNLHAPTPSRTSRFMSMKLQTGIVGLPNVGKSTLFNALVGSETAQAANFPFCTIGKELYSTRKLRRHRFSILNKTHTCRHLIWRCIWCSWEKASDIENFDFPLLTQPIILILNVEPNVGIVNVPDKRLDVLGEIHQSVKVVPAAVCLLVILSLMSKSCMPLQIRKDNTAVMR